MSKQNFIIKKFDLPEEKEVNLLRDLVFNYLDTFKNTGHMEEVRHMKEDIDKYYEDFYKLYADRYSEVNKLLYNYWKVSKLDNMGKPIPVMYLFPYKLVNSNGVLFTLCSYIRPTHYSNNGLHEESFDIMDDKLFKENDLLFEECTEVDLMNNAKQSCEDALSERLWKLKYRDNVLN